MANNVDVPWWWGVEDEAQLRHRIEKVVEGDNVYELETVDHGVVVGYDCDRLRFNASETTSWSDPFRRKCSPIDVYGKKEGPSPWWGRNPPHATAVYVPSLVVSVVLFVTLYACLNVTPPDSYEYR